VTAAGSDAVGKARVAPDAVGATDAVCPADAVGGADAVCETDSVGAGSGGCDLDHNDLISSPSYGGLTSRSKATQVSAVNANSGVSALGHVLKRTKMGATRLSAAPSGVKLLLPLQSSRTSMISSSSLSLEVKVAELGQE
jgi:hypothetical protein